VQEMRDVQTRVRHMDELGIDTQVVFPSIWLGCLAENVELEAALARSYNQFMATQCAQSDRFHGTYPPNYNEGTHLIAGKVPTQYQVGPKDF